MARSGRSRTRSKRKRLRPAVKLGVAPGTAVYVGEERQHRISVHVMHYRADLVREVHEASVAELTAARDASGVTWVDIDGVHDPEIVARVGKAFELHPLWVEDVLNPTSRPKVEWLGDKLLVVLRVVTGDGEELQVEQVALVLGPGWVVSFQEKPGDAWGPIRQRIRDGVGRARSRGADYLLHALMDGVIDAYFAVLQVLDARVDALEDEAIGARSEPDMLPRIAAVKTEVDVLRSALWPLREAIATLLRAEGSLIEAHTLPFFRDLNDHMGQLTDSVDNMRERLRAVIDMHLAMTSHQLNEVIRLLTMVSTIFIPLSFVAGVYGMNFRHMPELEWPLGYPLALAVMSAVAIGMLVFFRRRGWL